VGHPLVTWLLDERAHAGAEHLDEAYVAGYDTKSGLDPAEELELLRRHGLGPATTLVDIGAGTGVLALAAAPHCRRVVAVDPSPAMVARLVRTAPANVEVVEAGFLSYEHRGDPPELVHSRNALHHLSDFWKGLALARVRDLLAPNGVAIVRDLVFDFEPAEAEARIDDWLSQAAATPDAGWTRPELEAHLRSEHSTYSWLLEALLEHAGLAIVEASIERGIYATYVCTRR
jgi:SAM-dependent methyltransferase